MTLTLRLALRAYRHQTHLDRPGLTADADEVVALSEYMEERYICPTLIRLRPGTSS